MHSFRVQALAAALFTSIFLALMPAANAEDRIGVLLLHGKSPGNPNAPSLSPLRSRLEREGMLVLVPDMPWSRTRYIDGGWDKAMEEIAGHVRTLRERGASRIVLAGHSLGVPAALSHAARKGDVQALVLLAPGHVPYRYYTVPRLAAVRDSVNEARALVAAGKGDSTERFSDINQGRPQVLVMTAKNFLSYFDPESDAEMSVTAPRVPLEVPSIVVIGDKDPLFARARSYFADKLPANPKSRYLEVRGDHLSTAGAANDEVVEWIRTALAD